MRNFMIGATAGLVLGIFAGAAGAQSLITWSKREVLPVVMVEPSIGGFVPRGGSGLQATWSKAEVVPMIIVEPTMLGDFAPKGESPLFGNVWRKEAVKPFLQVEVTPLGQFSPSK